MKVGKLEPFVLIPAHNEGASLPVVIGDVRAHMPGVRVLVVDDGSTDDTLAVLAPLQVQVVRLLQRLGVGSAMRAGLRYAAARGASLVVRMDGDGQHRASDLPQVIEPIASGNADVVIGARCTRVAARHDSPWRLTLRRALARILSVAAGQRVSDPTSGFCAFGPAAIALLCEHHPTGYPEPELLLLARRHGLRVVEVPVGSHPRLAGRTTLTPARLIVTTGRVLLAMVIVPLRGAFGARDA